jgi:hypothetical protein
MIALPALPPVSLLLLLQPAELTATANTESPSTNRIAVIMIEP